VHKKWRVVLIFRTLIINHRTSQLQSAPHIPFFVGSLTNLARWKHLI
jgi:hypothetical protein